MIRSRSVTGVRARNHGFPVWPMGARWFWRPQGDGTRLQHRGGITALTVGYVPTDIYSYYDIGKGQYVAQDPTSEVIIPKSGRFSYDRLNVYNFSTQADRGFEAQAGLTVFTNAVPTDYILHSSFGIANGYRLSNTTGATRRVRQSRTMSATKATLFSCLVKRPDGGTVDGSTVTLVAWDTAGGFSGANEFGATIYQLVRDDGWHLLWAIFPATAGPPTRYIGLEVPDGIVIDVEAPQAEQINAGELSVPTDPIPAPGGGDTERGIFSLTHSPATGTLAMSGVGWLGSTLVPIWDEAEYTLVDSYVILWGPDLSNHHALKIDAAQQALLYLILQGGIVRAQYELPDTFYQKGIPLGVVAAWGTENGVTQASLCVNGQQIDTTTGFTMPTSNGPTLNLGTHSSTVPPDLLCQAMAFGDVRMHLNDARALSRWFQQLGHTVQVV